MSAGDFSRYDNMKMLLHHIYEFRKGVRVEYPDLASRVALSEAEENRGSARCARPVPGC